MVKKSTYADILEIAYRLFAEHGFDKTSMSMISKELKMTKPALYYHFPSKNSIIDALFNEICQSIRFEYFFDITSYTKQNFEQQFINDGLKILAAQQTDEYYARIMNQYQALGYREVHYAQTLINILEGFQTGFEKLLQYGASCEVVHTQDLSLAAQTLTMIIDGMDNFVGYGFHYRYEDIWIKTVQTIIKGD
ncbi:helix-turn-helix domain containing protein [Paenibacillus kyungheensis]|uniref:Helix-turn-helix domain containing protein n=1 Tax=Paenibacillus kyungheensis TaxID=1452732 RepID=A0AAX3M1G0_9BACL|nr:helix-turn-helix domain-containing protein [Paenibacillus kyungheensis]WCT56042.1 helix-turn-helix domain containing protein [Paenibacillus kyungheensis]